MLAGYQCCVAAVTAKYLRTHLGKLLRSGVEVDAGGDAILLNDDGISLFIAQFKREIGEGESDPSTQA
ncbi:hypothetical protein Clacol_010263 [Clathrus columnatus]|uniref:Uncharacterized protein n=1 Tax=Clathrus columnatus TaxID=1419009 RepID=A0AAV5ATA0_9AGAM|nr:hypothetical protein Clacol_010263 [Clathrus columnatus]